jgi:membrane protein DedA with SNARE-associated domain
MSEVVLQYITLFEPYANRYGYLVLFFGLLAENAAVPVPGETILIVSAFYSYFGHLNLGYVILIGICAAVLGDNISFYVGRRFGRPFVERYGGYIFISRKRLERIEGFFDYHGARAIFFQRWVTGFRIIGALMAGTTRMEWSRFLFYNFLGATVWVTVVGLLGYFFALNMRVLLRTLEHSGLALLGVVAILLIGAYLKKRRSRSARPIA